MYDPGQPCRGRRGLRCDQPGAQGREIDGSRRFYAFEFADIEVHPGLLWFPQDKKRADVAFLKGPWRCFFAKIALERFSIRLQRICRSSFLFCAIFEPAGVSIRLETARIAEHARSC
jgi:hypothetical protein